MGIVRDVHRFPTNDDRSILDGVEAGDKRIVERLVDHGRGPVEPQGFELVIDLYRWDDEWTRIGGGSVLLEGE